MGTPKIGYRGRFAPSPTGDLHMGNLFAALYVHQRAYAESGECLLRWEDLDTDRVQKGAAKKIRDSLFSLGFSYVPHQDDTDLIQSEEIDRYETALKALTDSGWLYACACSRKDLREIASAPHGPEGPIYPGTCREKDLPFSDPTLPVSWRFRVPPQMVRFQDRWADRFEQNVAQDVGDFVVRRKDGVIAYQLAVVLDDIHQGITEVVRGRDLLASTPRQILLYQALGHKPPSYAHGPLVIDEEGKKLSKRKGDQTLQSLLEGGVSSEQIWGWVGEALGVYRAAEVVTFSKLLESLTDSSFQRETVIWPAHHSPCPSSGSG
jgi:glutamyl-tRNA synthetase